MTQRARKDLIVCVIVAAAVAAAIVWQYRLGGARAWDEPVVYQEDALCFAAIVKAARDGHYSPLFSKTNPSLGAPFVANWNDFPLTEDCLYWLSGMAARCAGFWRTLNLGLVAVAMVTAATFYWLARRVGARRPAAFIGAFLFGIAPYLFYRSIRHFNLVNYWHVPLMLFVVFTLAHRPVQRWRRKWKLLASIAFLSGTLVVYFTYFFLLLLALTALWRLAQSKQVRETVPLLAVGLIAVAGFLTFNADSILYAVQHGANTGSVARDPRDSERYSLRPADLLIPPQHHRWWLLRRAGRAYEAQSLIQGEWPSAYLGIGGILALASVAAAAFVELARGRAGPAMRWAGTVLWLGGACCVGGLNSLYGLGGFYLFRGANRVSVVILALVLLFGVRLLSRWLDRCRAWAQWGAVAAMAIAGFWDQSPWRDSEEAIAKVRRLLDTDRVVAAFLQTHLARGAMVFQLPAMEYPVSHRLGPGEANSHFRPYLHTDGLRFSYGDCHGRPNAQWQFRVAAMPFDRMLATLRTNGFQALYVDKRGYTPDEIAKLKQLLPSTGPDRRFEAENFLVALLAERKQ
jgi:phosphoglycerol transferase